MRSRRSRHIQELRRAIDCLPVQTRVAMLEGVRSNPIIVGAYVDRRGGVCPMLAAHRCGGRTDFLSFARCWDRFTGARGRARRATERELRILTAHLEASLLADERVDLRGAIADHRALRDTRAQRDERAVDERRRSTEAFELAAHGGGNQVGVTVERVAGAKEHPAAVEAGRRDRRVRPGDAFRAGGARRQGASWMLVFRRLDDYERALARVEAERDALLAARDAREDALASDGHERELELELV